MRRVRNKQIHSCTPALLFARGVEQLVSDQLINPSRYDEREMEQIRRAPVKREIRGNIFHALLKQFAF